MPIKKHLTVNMKKLCSLTNLKREFIWSSINSKLGVWNYGIASLDTNPLTWQWAAAAADNPPARSTASL